MAESGDCGGDSVTSTSTKQKGGKLTQAGKFLKRIWPGTSSKKDGQNTGITTEKQSRMESRTSMECEPAEEEREECQPRGRGIGDMVHSPGTDPSGEIHHDRELSSKESSSLIQGAEQQNMVIPIHTLAEDGNRTAAPVTPTTRTYTAVAGGCACAVIPPCWTSQWAKVKEDGRGDPHVRSWGTGLDLPRDTCPGPDERLQTSRQVDVNSNPQTRQQHRSMNK